MNQYRQYLHQVKEKLLHYSLIEFFDFKYNDIHASLGPTLQVLETFFKAYHWSLAKTRVGCSPWKSA